MPRNNRPASHPRLTGRGIGLVRVDIDPVLSLSLEVFGTGMAATTRGGLYSFPGFVPLFRRPPQPVHPVPVPLALVLLGPVGDVAVVPEGRAGFWKGPPRPWAAHWRYCWRRKAEW